MRLCQENCVNGKKRSAELIIFNTCISPKIVRGEPASGLILSYFRVGTLYATFDIKYNIIIRDREFCRKQIINFAKRLGLSYKDFLKELKGINKLMACPELALIVEIVENKAPDKAGIVAPKGEKALNRFR